MIIPDWPLSLPQTLLLQGYSESPQSNLLRSPQDAGPAKVRRRTSSNVRKINGQLLMTSAQLAEFRTFYEDVLLAGSLRFFWVDPLSLTTTVEMRFVKEPQWVTQGSAFMISLELEILP